MDNVEKLNELLLDKNFCFQGTDGVRGKVLKEEKPAPEALILFKEKNIITPTFLEINCLAIATLLTEHNCLNIGGDIIFGEDGRDYYQDKVLRNSCMKGFSRAGLNTLDCGVLPTPAVFILAGYYNVKGGAILTASHNPSNQNGLKLFANGYKILPEEKWGDVALSQRMIEIALGKYLVESCAPGKSEDISKEALDVFNKIMKDSIGSDCDLDILYDTANGAFSQSGTEILDECSISYEVFNNSPDGININQNGGVAEIEGVEFFEGKKAIPDDLPLVKVLFEKGRKSPGKVTAAIVHDGDGDRGFVLLYDSKADRVFVLDGDILAYLRMKMLKEEGVETENKFAVFTVESDLAVQLAVSENLDIQTIIACVGDKWIVNEERKGNLILVAAESTGHVAETVEFKNKDGESASVICGNGILSALHVLKYIYDKKLTVSDIRGMIDTGVMKTFYTYFVDRSRFARGLKIFDENFETGRDVFRNWQKDDKANEDFTFEKLYFEDDRNMLYMAIKKGDDIQGACFVRNSGTELKIGINIRGKKEFELLLTEMALRIKAAHKEKLKDEGNIDYQREVELSEMLKENPEGLSEKELKNRFDIQEQEWNALLYGLKKEGSIKVRNGKVFLCG